MTLDSPGSRVPLPSGVFELSAEAVRWTCDPSKFAFATTAELEPPDAMIGQARAEAALDFGVDIQSRGFNIFVMGEPGTGRTSMILDRLTTMALAKPQPDDWCYVYNFDDVHRPRVLRLPPGAARQFCQQMEELLESLQDAMQRAFETEEYENQRNQIAQAVQDERRSAFVALESEAAAAKFAVVQTPAGLSMVPLIDGEPAPPDRISQLAPKVIAELDGVRNRLEESLSRTLRRLRTREKDARDRLRELGRSVARSVVAPLVDDLKFEYVKLPQVIAYLEAVAAHAIDNYEHLRGDESPSEPSESPIRPRQIDHFLPYQVNVLVTHEGVRGAPLVQESHPTYPNLVGRMEHRAEFGSLVTDFTMIKAGALHRANGGYLVIDAEDLLRNGLAYQALKRALRDGVIRIDSPADEMGVATPSKLDPEPIPLDVKVAVVGSRYVYYGLHDYDPDFPELFKVRAEFDTEIDLNDANIARYARFVAARCRDEQLMHLDPSAVARIVEEGVRLAENLTKLSTRFGDISDLIREAQYWARRAGATVVRAEHVQAATDASVRRANLLEMRMRERITDGTVLVQVTGSAIGRINGLSIVNVGGYEFGYPSRITARTYPGREGVVHIDREAKLTGPIHDKATMILVGYLNALFREEGPLSLAATLAFEQSYAGVEGDSASLAELVALLSSLSDVPIRQDVAITGSVNQEGKSQAVGGVSRKVEGFYDLCVASGLTGTQGVAVPTSNAKNLVLRSDVAEAVRQGMFHIYAVADVPAATELFMRLPAGKATLSGEYPPNTIFSSALAQLRTFSRRWHEGPPNRDR